MVSRVLIFVGLLPTLAYGSDLSWLDRVQSCDEFALGVTKFHSELPPLTNLSPEQGIELDRILAVACGDRFSRCGFKVCAEVTKSLPVVAPEPISIEDGEPVPLPTPTETLQQTATEPEVVATPELVESEPAPAATAVVVETATESDSGELSWLSSDLSCRELLEQVRKRYRAADSKNPKIPSRKREELKQVLKIVCSPRFAQCDFEACKTR